MEPFELTGLDGTPPPGVDIDSIFRIEKEDRRYVPTDRTWFNTAAQWLAA